MPNSDGYSDVSNSDDSQDDGEANQAIQEEKDGIPSEFAIRYNHHKGSLPKLVPIGNELLSNALSSKYDSLAYVIHCSKHDMIAVYQDEKAVVKWLPFTPLFPEKSWTDSCLFGTLLVLCNGIDDLYQKLKLSPPIESMQLLEILRIQQPQTLNFFCRLIFYVKIKSNQCYQCCSPLESISWVPLKTITSGHLNNIWGPEIVQFSRIIENNFAGYNERIEEFSLDDVYLYSPRDPPRNAEETMLLELDISEKTIEVLYNDYCTHCFPCFSMPFDSFKHYFFKYGIGNDPRLEPLFMAFNYKRTGFVGFHELLMGLSSLEPLAPHGETRIKFIFRFYDLANKGYLDLKDFEHMVKDIYPGLDEEQARKKMEESVRLVGTVVKDKQLVITFANLMNAIRTHKFRGTSKLCRSSVAVFMQLTRAFSFKKRTDSDNTREWKNLAKVIIPQNYKDTCKMCKKRRFELATFSVDINPKGWQTKASRIIKPDKRKEKERKPSHVENRSEEILFSKSYVANVFIKIVREFNKHKGVVKEPRGLLDKHPKDQKRMLALFTELYNEIKPILKAESRCPNISVPCIVIGDIHGNIEDLLTLEKLLWRRVPCFGPNFLFLGDYVDRGRWSVECAVYLLSLKLLEPKKIILLRGNHEVRPLQEKYTYKKECIAKYGTDIGVEIWHLSNQIFDMLPVAATVDSAIFCVHGGLSPNAKTLDQIRSIPTVLENPELQSKIAWELLWSDPCHMQQYLDVMEIMDVNSEFAIAGYVTNSKRGAAYLFNERAAQNFLNANGLSHMIRAHEVPPYGFQHHFQNLCTTVFSCSHYCNNENEAACILVDKSRIRAVRIDTHNNAPATEK